MQGAIRAHLTVKILGKVQGVAFRYAARVTAEELGLMGFVRNEDDGSVYLEAEGEKEGLEKFLKWCAEGPPESKVEHVEVEWSTDLRGFQGFVVE